MHEVIKNTIGRPVIETFENDNVRITRFLNGDIETELKHTCDPKVKSIYNKLIKPIKIKKKR